MTLKKSISLYKISYLWYHRKGFGLIWFQFFKFVSAAGTWSAYNISKHVPLYFMVLTMWAQTVIYWKSLTHWGRVTHICVSNLTIITSDNGLSPGRRQAIIWTNGAIMLIWPLGTNFNKISIEINSFSFKKMHLKMSSGKWRPFCLGLNGEWTFNNAE